MDNTSFNDNFIFFCIGCSAKDYLSIGINLSISAMTILITNYQSYTAVWLIVIDFAVIWFVSIIIRKRLWSESLFGKTVGCIIFSIVGCILCWIAIQYAHGNIQQIIA